LREKNPKSITQTRSSTKS
jgi:hypothetical protein